MFRNYIKTALRSLFKQKIYTAINILGLSVSITACLLIVLYVKHETSYDTFFPNSDCIYKFVLERKYPNHSTFYSPVPHSYAQSIERDYPEVEKSLIIQGPVKDQVISYKYGNGEIKSFEEDYALFVDSGFFSFFDIPLIKGDKKTALSLPNQVIISSAIAQKYFGGDDPLGKILSGDFGEVKVSGVFEALPDNSHLKFDMLVSFDRGTLDKNLNYVGFDAQTYIKLKPGADYKALEAKFPQLVETYAAPQIEKNLGKSWADYKKEGNGYNYFLQPLASIHLDPRNIEFTFTPSGNIRYIYILSSIAILILVIACINFMNLATARSSERAREVGVRKVMGSFKNQLIVQFLVEAFMLSLLGTAIAVLVTGLLLPAFNVLVGKQLHLLFTYDVILGLLCFALLVGFLAGIYPAFVLSGFNPVVVMKGSFTSGAKGSWLRNGLVVFQFMISIVLMVGTLIVGQQMNFMQNKDLGFDKEQMLMVKRAFVLEGKSEAFMEEVKKIPGVITAAGTSSRVGNRDDVFGQQFRPEGVDEILTTKSMTIDDDFAQEIKFELKEGRFFTKETNDSLNILLNETAVKTAGLINPIGYKLHDPDFTRTAEGKSQDVVFTVVGVVKNFHFQSLRDEITPLVIFSHDLIGRKNGSIYVAIRVNPEKVQQILPQVEAVWKQLVPQQPFQYEFLDENLAQGYAEEQRASKLFNVFSGLAIIIACVGLFGLSAYTASLRTREIGIRKVLGASTGGVVVLLSKDFTKLVILAFILAVPLSAWMMEQWLNGFAYRIPLGIGSFIAAGFLALAIAWLTVSYQSIKAAIVNPVKSLKGE